MEMSETLQSQEERQSYPIDAIILKVQYILPMLNRDGADQAYCSSEDPVLHLLIAAEI